MDESPRVGVLVVQGAFDKHIATLHHIGVEAVRVRQVEQVAEIDGLIIPGGESTTVGKLMERFELLPALRERGRRGLPIFGTCMGMIVMAQEIADSDQQRLDLLNVTVRRNAFGRQTDSFEADLRLAPFPERDFRAVFIRAPIITRVGDGVEVLGRFEDHVVFVRQGNLLAAAFHPELTDDLRIHEYFLEMVRDYRD